MLLSPLQSVSGVNPEVTLHHHVGRGVLVGNTVSPGVNGHHLVNVVIRAQRGLILGNDLCGALRADLAGNGARIGTDFHLDYRGGTNEIADRHAFQAAFHDVVPDRAGAVHPADTVHHPIVGVSYPHPHHTIRCVADSPAVAIAVGGARFHRSRTG